MSMRLADGSHRDEYTHHLLCHRHTKNAKGKRAACAKEGDYTGSIVNIYYKD